MEREEAAIAGVEEAGEAKEIVPSAERTTTCLTSARVAPAVLIPGRVSREALSALRVGMSPVLAYRCIVLFTCPILVPVLPIPLFSEPK